MNLRIKEVSKSKEIKTALLADKVGITRANMSNIVNGKTTPSLLTLEKIASALEVDITELFEPARADEFTCPRCGTSLTVSQKK